MESFKSLFRKENMGQLVLGILFIIYIIMGYDMPESIATMVDTMAGKIIVVIIALSLFAYANPVIAILGLYVAYIIITRSSMATGSVALEKYMPSEEKKMSEFSAYNQFPYTLEQEVVKKMAPINKSCFLDEPATFKPMLENLYDASPIDGSN